MLGLPYDDQIEENNQAGKIYMLTLKQPELGHLNVNKLIKKKRLAQSTTLQAKTQTGN